MTIDAADVVRRLRERIGQEFDDECSLDAAEAQQIATLIETLVRERDEARQQIEATAVYDDGLSRRIEDAESALRQANARIAEMEGALRQIADTPWSGVRIGNGDASYHEMKRLASAALRSQSEETR